jgi:hypothetical protein
MRSIKDDLGLGWSAEAVSVGAISVGAISVSGLEVLALAPGLWTELRIIKFTMPCFHYAELEVYRVKGVSYNYGTGRMGMITQILGSLLAAVPRMSVRHWVLSRLGQTFGSSFTIDSTLILY